MFGMGLLLDKGFRPVQFRWSAIYIYGNYSNASVHLYVFFLQFIRTILVQKLIYTNKDKFSINDSVQIQILLSIFFHDFLKQ